MKRECECVIWRESVSVWYEERVWVCNMKRECECVIWRESVSVWYEERVWVCDSCREREWVCDMCRERVWVCDVCVYPWLVLYMYKYVHLRKCWSKETPPTGRFPFWVVSKCVARRKSTPSKNNLNLFKIMGSFHRGGGSFSSRLMIWKLPKMETPLGGGSLDQCIGMK